MTKECHIRHKEMTSTNQGLYQMGRIYGLMTAIEGLQTYQGYNYNFTAYWRMAWVRLIYTQRGWKLSSAWHCIKFSIPIRFHFHSNRDSIKNWRKQAKGEKNE